MLEAPRVQASVAERLLHRALFWAASQDDAWGAWQSTNVKTEATYFAKAGKLVVINNAGTDSARR